MPEASLSLSGQMREIYEVWIGHRDQAGFTALVLRLSMAFFFAPVSLGLEAVASLIFSLSSTTTHREQAPSSARAGDKTGTEV